MNGKTRLKDIAEALNLSIATVSRALHDKSDIKTDTKNAVLEMAKELNYKPNNHAISLRKSDSFNVIGVVMPLIRHNFFASILQGIMAKAHANGYFVLIGESLHDSQKEKSILDRYTDYGVSGILLAPCKHSDFSKNLLPIIHRRIPVVVMDRMYNNYNGNFVSNNDFEGAYQAVSHLIHCGYKRIAHIASSDSWSIGHERYQGYLAALKDHDIEIEDNYIHSCNFNNKEEGAEEGYRATRRLFSLKTPPTAIFSVTDDIAVGVYQFAKEHDINIPKDLGVIGYSNSEVSSLLTPPLTTIEQHADKMGKLSFDFFLNAINSNGQLFQKTLEPQLLLRGSTCAVTTL